MWLLGSCLLNLSRDLNEWDLEMRHLNELLGLPETVSWTGETCPELEDDEEEEQEESEKNLCKVVTG